MKMTKETRKKLLCLCMSSCMILSAASMTASAADDDYWRYTLTYNDAKWKTATETTESNVSIDGTNIISGLTNAKTYFDVTNETVGSVSDDASLQTKVFKTKLDSTATATSVTGSTINITDKSATEVNNLISYSFDFKPLDHINKQNYRVLTVRFGAANPLYQYALIVEGLQANQTKDGKAAVGIGLGNADAAVGYASSVTTGQTNDWSACGVWYQYYITIDKNTKTVTVGVKNADTDTVIGEQVFTDVTNEQLANFSSNTPVYASVKTDGASFEFKNSDKITYTVEEAAAELFDTSIKTSCTDSYLKLTAKDEYAGASEKLSSGNFLSIISGGNRPCVTSGVYDYSMLFKVNKRTDNVSNKLLMSARMANDLTWSYALKVVGLSDNQRANSLCIGLGGVDTDNGVMQTGCNNWTSADAWYKYYININYYTKKVTVGVTNMTTGEEVFTPYVADIDTTMYTNLNTTVQACVRRYGADYSIDDVTESRDIFVHGDAEITTDATTVTAKVPLANDVHSGAYNPTYNGDKHEPMLILATYDKDDRMINISYVKPTVVRTKAGTGDLTWVDVSTSVAKTDDYSYAKVFLWKSISDDITPFCDEVFTTKQ